VVPFGSVNIVGFPNNKGMVPLEGTTNGPLSPMRCLAADQVVLVDFEHPDTLGRRRYNGRGGERVRVDAGRLMVGLAAMLVGILLVVQARLQRIVPPPTQTQELLSQLSSADQRRDALAKEVARLQQELNQRLTAQAAQKRLDQELVQAEILAGTIPVQGPGITVVWGNGTAPAAFQIEDLDLLQMVNELRAAGAEAIAINGQRITAETEIRNASNYILINGTQEGAPFTIQAIGPVAAMTQALELPGGLMQVSEAAGRTMTISSSRHLVLPAAELSPLDAIKPAN